ncbi:MAG: TolC family protein [Puniceicoccales bacterium]|nr:TolC family protein [Puniceicoccales bacterium]
MRIFSISWLMLVCCRVVGLECGATGLPRICVGNIATSKQHIPSSLHVEKNTSADLVGKVELDLALLTDIAFENSPETRRAWHLVQVAEAQKNRTQSAFFPTISLSSSLTRKYVDNPTISGDPYYLTVSASPSVCLNYTLFTFGADHAAAKAAKHNLATARFQCSRSLQTLLFRVQSCYFAFNGALSSMDAREANLRDATEVCKLAEARLQAGLGDRQSFLQARAAMLRAEFDLEETKAAVEKARADLAATVGVCVSKNFRILRSALPDEMECLNLSVEQLVSEALASRRDVLATHAQFQTMESIERVAKLQWGPRVVGTAESSNEDYRHFGTGKSFSFSIAVKWDIQCGLEKFHQWREQQAQKKIAFENLRGVELRAAGEVWSQYFAYLSAHKRLCSARALLAAAKESFKATELAYRGGLGSFIDLLNSQNVLARAREGLAAAESVFSTSLAALAYAIGSLERLCP